MVETIKENEAEQRIRTGEENEMISSSMGEDCVFVDGKIAMPGRSLYMMFEIDEWIYLMKEAKEMEPGESKEFDIRGQEIELKMEDPDKWVMKHINANYRPDEEPSRTYFSRTTITKSLDKFRL